jgi:2-polyprenyl-3-methyl-5-hydroxy-6-metoxy-1,4-benzoquinol methylase
MTPPDRLSFRDQLIRQHARGLSFADVGALWCVSNEKISVAAKAGARSTCIIDVTPLDHSVWDECRQYCRALGVSDYAEYSQDIDDPEVQKIVGSFDFVYCSGVIYHVPSVFYTLQRLRSICERFLMLGSMIVPSVIQNEHGTIDLRGGAMIFVPGIDPD